MAPMRILQMSLEASLLILVIVVIRSLALHRLPKSTFLALWGVAAARLLIPLQIPSALSIHSLLERLGSLSASVGGGVTAMRAVEMSGAAATAPTSEFSLLSPSALWLAGFALCAAFFAVTYFSCVRRFSSSLPVESSFISGWLGGHRTLRKIMVRRSDAVSSPLTYGILRPVILLPDTTDCTDGEQLSYVLAHEHMHIRRFDAAVKLLLALVVSLHWFNPAVWVMYILANRDLELCCDEHVVRSLGENAKALYALALIGMAEKQCGLTPLCSGFCKTAAEERIVSIMKIKKTSAWSAALAVALIVCTSAVFATSAKNNDSFKLIKLSTIATENSASASATIRESANGGKEISIDGGKTWENLQSNVMITERDDIKIVWWTAGEYAKWLEQEKKTLQSYVGTENGFYVDGKLVKWTQEEVDETIAMYEKQLQDIKNGLQVSKTVDGKDNISISMNANTAVSAYDIKTSAKDGKTVKFAAENLDSIPATEITEFATTSKLVPDDTKSIPATKIIKYAEMSKLVPSDAKSIPATKITKYAEMSKLVPSDAKSIPATKIIDNAKAAK